MRTLLFPNAQARNTLLRLLCRELGNGKEMNRERLLRIYLQDHDALSLITLRLARRSRSSNEGAVLGEGLAELESAVADDRRRLRATMDALGVRPSRIKTWGAWLAETLGRLKLNGRLVRYSELSRVHELDGLAALLTIASLRWEVLGEVAGRHLESAGVDFEVAGDRLAEQQNRLAAHRFQAALDAFP